MLDYKYMESKGIKPRFDFGFGLSYTTFEYSGLEISASGTGVAVVATIKNAGVVPGTEIPQLYLGFPANAGEPPKVLRGFDEVFLQAGSSSSVTFNLNQRDLRSVPDPRRLNGLHNCSPWRQHLGCAITVMGSPGRYLHCLRRKCAQRYSSSGNLLIPTLIVLIYPLHRIIK